MMSTFTGRVKPKGQGMAGRWAGGGKLLCACLLLLAAPLLTAGQDEEGAVEEGFACPMEVALPRCPSAAGQLQP